MGKNLTPCFMLHLELIWMESHQVRYLLILQVKFLVGDLSKGHGGHSRSPTVFLPITWEQNEIETWDCCHCVFLRKAHRMMYNLTYLSHRVTLPWLDLRSNYTWFDASWRDKHDGIKMVALPLKLKILSSKNRFGKILEFWPLVTSILTWAKKWPKWFRNDFSRAFERRFPFFSTMRRSRGCSNTPPPPPPAGGGKSRGPAGRGLTLGLSWDSRQVVREVAKPRSVSSKFWKLSSHRKKKSCLILQIGLIPYMVHMKRHTPQPHELSAYLIISEPWMKCLFTSHYDSSLIRNCTYYSRNNCREIW